MVDNRKPYEPPRVRDIASQPIEPDDVCKLLNVIEIGDSLLPVNPFVAVPRHIARELVMVWLRVASMHEHIEQNPLSHTKDELCAIKALLLGQCEHGTGLALEHWDKEHDTEPQNEKPEPPTGVLQ